MRAVSQRVPSIHNSEPDPGLDTAIPPRASKALQTRWAAGRQPLGQPGTYTYDSHPMEFSRDQKVPASVCSQSNKHRMGVGGLRDKGRVVGPRSSWSGDAGETQLGCPGHLSGVTSLSPSPQWTRRVGRRAAPPSGGLHPLAGTPAPLPGRTPEGRPGVSRSPCPQGECCPFCAL